jgi:hypothetical protein
VTVSKIHGILYSRRRQRDEQVRDEFPADSELHVAVQEPSRPFDNIDQQ